MYEFEYDPIKSRINKEKHGIDFEEAQALWNGAVMELPSQKGEEERFLVTGHIEDKGWTAIIAKRGARIRIISVRRAREKEGQNYAERIGH